MCAPKNDLAKLAIIGAAAYATGGISLGSTAATTAREAYIIANSGATATASTTSVLTTLLNTARTALPIIGAAGNVYSGYLQSQILKQQAGAIGYEIAAETDAFAMRKAIKRREMIKAIGKQNALYGITGTTLEGSPADVLSLTAANYQQDIFTDAWNTSGKILGKKQQADILNQEANAAVVSGFVKAGTYLGTRGFGDLITKTVTTPKTVNTRKSVLDTGVQVGDM